MRKFAIFFDRMMEKDVSLSDFLFGFLGLVFLRVFIERFLAISREADAYAIVLEFIHNILFFLVLFLLLWIFLSLFLKMNPKKMGVLFLWASFLIVFPPILDMIKTGGEVYWSFYLLSSLYDLKVQFWSIFGHLPSGIMYFGTRIVFVMAIAIIAIFTIARTKSAIKTLIAAIGAYLLMFFMGAFPTLFFFGYSLLTGGMKIGEIQGFNVAQFFLGNSRIFGVEAEGLGYAFVYKLDFLLYLMAIILLAVIFWLIDKKKLYAILKNARWPQVFYHAGLFFVGIALGAFKHPESFSLNIFSLSAVLVLLCGVFFSWKASVVVNDFYDQRIDMITNKERPLSGRTIPAEEYSSLGKTFFALALLSGIIVGFKFFAVFLAYQAVAWVYSAKPFRLKRFPIVATFVSAFASLLIFFLGYVLFSPGQTIVDIPFRIIVLLVIAYTISIPLKDFKDIDGDKAEGIRTIPVIFGEKNARIIVASGIFLSFILSVFLLNERRLFWWAVVFGVIGYFSISSCKMKPRLLPWAIFALTLIYGCILVWVAILGK